MSSRKSGKCAHFGSLLDLKPYDALNRATQIAYSDQTFSFIYDQGTNGIGRLSSVTEASGQTNFSYDALGRVTQKTHVIGTTSLALSYAYQNGDLVSLTTPSGQTLAYSYGGAGSTTGLGNATFTYNGARRMSSATQGAAGVTFAENAFGQRVSKA